MGIEAELDQFFDCGANFSRALTEERHCVKLGLFRRFLDFALHVGLVAQVLLNWGFQILAGSHCGGLEAASSNGLNEYGFVASRGEAHWRHKSKMTSARMHNLAYFESNADGQRGTTALDHSVS